MNEEPTKLPSAGSSRLDRRSRQPWRGAGSNLLSASLHSGRCRLAWHYYVNQHADVSHRHRAVQPTPYVEVQLERAGIERRNGKAPPLRR